MDAMDAVEEHPQLPAPSARGARVWNRHAFADILLGQVEGPAVPPGAQKLRWTDVLLQEGGEPDRKSGS